MIEPSQLAIDRGAPRPRVRALCSTDGLVDAVLTRGRHRMGKLIVDDVLGYECPVCKATCAFPPHSSGRIFAAQASRADWAPQEFRVPRELEDLALSVHAHFGTPPNGDVFSLPLHLGLRLVGAVDVPDEAWRMFDDFQLVARARPVLSDETVRRLDGLRTVWRAASRSDVFRWLIVSAWKATQLGFTAFVESAENFRSFDVPATDFIEGPTPQMIATMKSSSRSDAITVEPPTMVLQ